MSLCVFKYLVWPTVCNLPCSHVAEQLPSLPSSSLSQFPECDVIPAVNENVLIVVTNSWSSEEADRLNDLIAMLPGFESMAFVSDYCDKPTEETDE